MAARIVKIKIKRLALDVWGAAPARKGNTRWELFVPFGLSLDWGLGGILWLGWGWSGQILFYVDVY